MSEDKISVLKRKIEALQGEAGGLICDLNADRDFSAVLKNQTRLIEVHQVIQKEVKALKRLSPAEAQQYTSALEPLPASVTSLFIDTEAFDKGALLAKRGSADFVSTAELDLESFAEVPPPPARVPKVRKAKPVSAPSPSPSRTQGHAPQTTVTPSSAPPPPPSHGESSHKSPSQQGQGVSQVPPWKQVPPPSGPQPQSPVSSDPQRQPAPSPVANAQPPSTGPATQDGIFNFRTKKGKPSIQAVMQQLPDGLSKRMIKSMIKIDADERKYMEEKLKLKAFEEKFMPSKGEKFSIRAARRQLNEDSLRETLALFDDKFLEGQVALLAESERQAVSVGADKKMLEQIREDKARYMEILADKRAGKKELTKELKMLRSIPLSFEERRNAELSAQIKKAMEEGTLDSFYEDLNKRCISAVKELIKTYTGTCLTIDEAYVLLCENFKLPMKQARAWLALAGVRIKPPVPFPPGSKKERTRQEVESVKRFVWRNYPITTGCFYRDMCPHLGLSKNTVRKRIYMAGFILQKRLGVKGSEFYIKCHTLPGENPFTEADKHGNLRYRKIYDINRVSGSMNNEIIRFFSNEAYQKEGVSELTYRVNRFSKTATQREGL